MMSSVSNTVFHGLTGILVAAALTACGKDGGDDGEGSEVGGGPGIGSSLTNMTTPATVLEGDELVRRREATLGETLSSEPGITSSHFGAGASRPIIRGMDGPRVRVLSDGAELHDASTISPDHAVVSEPMLATQIEVLRGPSALVYGNGAVGGVVNVLDGKVPTAVPAKGYEGSLELRANSGASEKAGVFSLTGGTGNLDLTIAGFPVGGLLNLTFYGNVDGSPASIAVSAMPSSSASAAAAPGSASASSPPSCARSSTRPPTWAACAR